MTTEWSRQLHKTLSTAETNPTAEANKHCCGILKSGTTHQMKQAFNCFLLFASILVFSGCSHQNPKEAAEARRVESVGDTMQKQGLMSSRDWADFDRLDKLSGTQRSLNEKDFALLLKLMEAHQGMISTSPSNSVVIAHVMALDVFRNMTRATPEQKRKIISSVSLLLNSSNQQEVTLAKRVIDEFKGSS